MSEREAAVGQPSVQRAAGTSSGSRGCAPAGSASAERHAQRLRQHDQLLAAQVLVEQRHAEEIQRRHRSSGVFSSSSSVLSSVRAGRPGSAAGRAGPAASAARAAPAAGRTRRRPAARSRPAAWRRDGQRGAQRALRIAADPVFGEPGRCGRPATAAVQRRRALRHGQRGRAAAPARSAPAGAACGCARPSAPATAVRGRRGAWWASSMSGGRWTSRSGPGIGSMRATGYKPQCPRRFCVTKLSGCASERFLEFPSYSFRPRAHGAGFTPETKHAGPLEFSRAVDCAQRASSAGG